MDKFMVSPSFESFSNEFNLDSYMKKVESQINALHKNEKADITFVYKIGSSTCIKIAKDIAEQIDIADYVGISYFADDKMFVISSKFSNTGVLYPVSYNKTDKKYRCYRAELFKALVEAADITFNDCTCVSYRNAKVEEHPKLGKIAIVYVDEN